MRYESTVTVESRTAPGVQFAVRRMSFGRRLELMRQVRDLAARAEYHAAGSEPKEKIEAAVLGGEIDRLYLEWGVVRIEGLDIDGEPAGTAEAVEKGPEELAREMLKAVMRECGLNEEERKN